MRASGSSFDLSSVRASEWIREFREKHPDWTEWNSKTRSYHASLEAYRGSGRTRIFASKATRFRFPVPRAGWRTSCDHRIVSQPHHLGSFPRAFRSLSRIFALMSEAIRARRALQITYRSMREPTPHQRVYLSS